MSLATAWSLILTALVAGILAGHFGWGRRWPRLGGRLHPDYLAGLDYLVTEQPDRALDVFLKLMDANADTVETHFALGALYRRRGEVERAIRIHRSLLARELLPREHREQALFALAQDHLRAGLLDRAERLLTEVSEVPRLKASALVALRGVYERQHEWRQALDTFRQLARARATPPRSVAAHYLCELAALAIEREEVDEARALLRQARSEASSFPRAALLRAKIAQARHETALAIRLIRIAVRESPDLLTEELAHLLQLAGADGRDDLLIELASQVERQDLAPRRNLLFAAIVAGVGAAPVLHDLLVRTCTEDATLNALWTAAGADPARAAAELAALLERAERYRCAACGFAGRSFYWRCPACQSWDTFESHALVKLS